MKKNLLSLPLIALTSLLFSCREGSDGETGMERIQIPFDRTETLDINKGDIIPLETTDKSLFTDVKIIEKMDSDFIVLSTNSVLRFDTTGRYTGGIGALGHSSSEYLDTRNMFLSENRIGIFDWTSHKVIFYDGEGRFLSKMDVQHGEHSLFPSTLIPLKDGTYLSNNCYQGDDLSTPSFSIFSSSGEPMYPLKGMKKKDGMTHNELRYSPKTNTVLYTEYFNDTIYRVSPENMNVTKAYYIDFGEHKYTEEEKAGKDFVELCAYSNLKENVENKATALYCCYETDDQMMFVFMYQAHIFFTVYNKDEHAIRVFRLEDKTGNYKPTLFAVYMKDEVIFCCEDMRNMENNPVLVRMPYHKILEK